MREWVRAEESTKAAIWGEAGETQTEGVIVMNMRVEKEKELLKIHTNLLSAW